MKLIDLLKNITDFEHNIDMNIDIEYITNDSRSACKNSLFFAIKGYEVDGMKFAQKALESGAVAVVCQEKPKEDIPYILVGDVREIMAVMSANFYNNPAENVGMIGITGTNGKTTTTYLVKHILECHNKKTGLVGTNQNMIGDEIIETERTTPESIELQKLILDMKKANCSDVIMEVSSHSLVLNRVNAINFTVGAFTNLSQDHLDFHKTFDEYAAAKSLLFKQCKIGVINLDDEYSNTMINSATCEILTFGIDNDKADLNAKNIELKSDGVKFDVWYKNECKAISLAIPGKFSVYNALCAIGCCLAYKISLSDIAKSLITANGVKGRVEVVPTKTDYTVLIDYAHSPDGIENVLKAVKGFAKGKVIAVFGCGGDRDKTKRPLMAKASAKYADLCIITSDNPRTEQPCDIISDILVGMKDAKCPYETIEDRRQAIVYALDIANTDDIIVLMGKGHETYQEINHVKHHLDEREEVAKYFA